jgi:3-oxoacyl-[acyl-carrier protein] reductase
MSASLATVSRPGITGTSLRLLDGKVAVIYGAAGGVGSAVAKTFAREGARLFLVGRTLTSLQTLAAEISKSGGTAEAAVADALNPKAVEDHLQSVVAEAGRIDVSFNLISSSVGMGRALTSLTEEQFSRVTFTVLRSVFVTATAAARQMERQGSGVVLGLTASVARIPKPNLGGFPITGAALEALYRQLGLEVGPRGVRVVVLRTGSTPDNPVFREVYAELARVNHTTPEEVEKSLATQIALKRLPMLREVANAAALLASDYASVITATAVDASGGDLVD